DRGGCHMPRQLPLFGTEYLGGSHAQWQACPRLVEGIRDRRAIQYPKSIIRLVLNRMQNL
ncbi:MAG: hypothetical protein VYC98_07185, partial [Planctomycetota bacterium]|nr:hypothetical protein [Planctomycetota bacterium]